MLALARRQHPVSIAMLLCFAGGVSAQSYSISTDDGTSVLNFHKHPSLGIVLDSVGDQQDPQAMPFGQLGMWQLEFHRGASCILIGPENLSSFELDVDVKSDRVKVEWDEAKSALLPDERFNVEVEIRADKKTGEFEAKIHVKTQTPLSVLHRVRFPRLELVVAGNPTSTRLAMPVGHGVLLVNPSQNVAITGPAKLNAFLPPCDAVTIAEPGVLSMQWWALYDQDDPEKAQLFFGTHDKKGYKKEWLFEQVPASLGTLRFRPVLRNVPADNATPNGDYKQSFPFVFKVLRGDWYDGARHYRNWALKQPWTDTGPMAVNTEFSDILRQSDMLGVTQVPAGPDDPGTFCPSDPNWNLFSFWPAETIAQDVTFGVQNIVPRIFFWDFNSFLRDVGDWFPIRQPFKDAANALVAQGDDYSAYFLSQVYSTRIPSYTQSYVPDSVNGGTYGPVEPWGIINEDGAREFQTSVVCQPAPVAVQELEVCQATQFAADYTAYVARRLFDEAGARGLYVDVLTGTDVRLCYDNTHGHPLGGGFYYTEGLKHQLETVRVRMREDGAAPVPEYFLESEGAGEHFLPWLEAVHPHLTWTRTQTFCDVFTGQCPRNGTDFLVTPLYGTVYHDFQLTSATLQLNAPRTLIGSLGIPILADPFFMRSLRNLFSAHVALGWTPFAGTILSQHLTTDNANPALFPDYFRLTELVQRVMSVLQLDAVRDFTTFGPRLRDPRVTRADAADSPVTSVRFDLAPFAHNWLAYGRSQPFVYATIYGRGAIGGEPWGGWSFGGEEDDGWGFSDKWGFGWDDDGLEADWGDGFGDGGWEDGSGWKCDCGDETCDGVACGFTDGWAGSWQESPANEIGLLVLNWSDPSDNLFFQTLDAGQQNVRITFDPEQYSPGAETYSIFLVSASGETPFASGTVTGPVSTTVTVPARTALFFRIEFGQIEE